MKDQWFREYERLWDEREDSDVPETYKQSDVQLAERATAILMENGYTYCWAHRADIARDEEGP